MDWFMRRIPFLSSIEQLQELMGFLDGAKRWGLVTPSEHRAIEVKLFEVAFQRYEVVEKPKEMTAWNTNVAWD